MELKKFLELNRLSYIGVLQLLENNNLEILYFDGDNNAVLKEKNGNCFIIGSDPIIFDYLPKDCDLCFFEKGMGEKTDKKHSFIGDTFVRESREKFDIKSEEYTFRFLDDRDYNFVQKYYGYEGMDKNFVVDRIKAKAMIGAFDKNNDCLGFIGYHPELTIGLLYVLEEHRGKGIASFLEKNIINILINKNYVLYNNVHPNNIASQKLQKKLGFIKASKQTHWFW